MLSGSKTGARLTAPVSCRGRDKTCPCFYWCPTPAMQCGTRVTESITDTYHRTCDTLLTNGLGIQMVFAIALFNMT